MEFDVRATTTDGIESGIEHDTVLIEFSNAVMGPDEGRLDRARDALRRAVGDAGFHETAAVAANFNQMDRIADSTGIPLDGGPPMIEVGKQIGTDRFVSAQNTLRHL